MNKKIIIGVLMSITYILVGLLMQFVFNIKDIVAYSFIFCILGFIFGKL